MGVEDVAAIAVLFQSAGSILLGVIIGQLAQILSSRAARWWSAAWFAFAVALISVRFFIAFQASALSVVYLLFEWLFLFLLWCGCRELTGRSTPPRAMLFYLLPIAVVAAIVLARSARTFNDVFIYEAAVMSISAFASYRELLRTVASTRGVAAMRAALGLFAVLYAAYVPLFLMHTNFTPIPMLAYSSFADLLVSIFVGCTMVLVIAEAENRRTTDLVSELEQARSVVEQRLHTDALTEALSRHAFHWMKQGAEVATEALSGSVVMIDIDGLKEINDTYGHDCGDMVIRAVANALRAVIRGDDLLFRWGGDEFVAILPNLPERVVAQRLTVFDRPIAVAIGNGREIACRISCGYSEFGAQQNIDDAMRVADQRMYERRQARDAQRK